MKILVIDDKPQHQESARETLAEHDLTICGTVEDAYRALENNDWRNIKEWPYEAVLTDLWMPMPKPTESGDFLGCQQVRHLVCGDKHGGEGERYGEMEEMMVPVGLVFALRAVFRNTPYVAILTDTDHHTDRVTALLDLVSVNRSSRRMPVFKYEYRDYSVNGAKDWGRVLRDMLKRK